MAKKISKPKKKFKKVMHEFKEGKLHSGSKKGPQVTNPKQAVAIAYSEEHRKAKKDESKGMKKKSVKKKDSVKESEEFHEVMEEKLHSHMPKKRKKKKYVEKPSLYHSTNY